MITSRPAAQILRIQFVMLASMACKGLPPIEPCTGDPSSRVQYLEFGGIADSVRDGLARLGDRFFVITEDCEAFAYGMTQADDAWADVQRLDWNQQEALTALEESGVAESWRIREKRFEKGGSEPIHSAVSQFAVGSEVRSCLSCTTKGVEARQSAVRLSRLIQGAGEPLVPEVVEIEIFGSNGLAEPYTWEATIPPPEARSPQWVAVAQEPWFLKVRELHRQNGHPLDPIEVDFEGDRLTLIVRPVLPSYVEGPDGLILPEE